MKLKPARELLFGYRTLCRSILLPVVILFFLVRDSFLGYSPEYEKCRVWKTYGGDWRNNISIECFNMDLTNLNDLEYFTQFLSDLPSPCRCMSLSLINFKYPNGALQDSWFCSKGLLNLNIQSLRIEGGLSRIEADGLRCLPILDSLTLSGTSIRHLWKRPFQNIPNLKRFELSGDNFLSTADPNFFSGMTRLAFLRITNLNTEQNDTQKFLKNLMSDDLEIETVDWSNSNLGLVPTEVLARLPTLKVMDLRSARLRSLDDGFDKLKSLTVLKLYNNEIRSVPERNREWIERLSALYLRQNPLLCDCDMVWLQKYINENRNGTFGDFGDVVCEEPPELKNVPFLKAKMCEPDRPKPPACPMIEIACQSSKDNKTRRFEIGDVKKSGEIVKIEGEKQNFTVAHNEISNTVNISIVNGKGKRKTVLYWPSTETNRPTYKCVTDITDTFTAAVKEDTNYMICVFDRSDKISLSDCKPFRTEKRYSDQVWLTNNMKPKVSAIAGFLLLTALLAGGGLAYLLLRHNPALLSGSKRVITVKGYRRTSIMVMPKGYNPDSQRQPVYADIGNDETSSTASYISAIPPRPADLLAYRLQMLRKYALPYPPP